MIGVHFFWSLFHDIVLFIWFFSVFFLVLGEFFFFLRLGGYDGGCGGLKWFGCGCHLILIGNCFCSGRVEKRIQIVKTVAVLGHAVSIVLRPSTFVHQSLLQVLTRRWWLLALMFARLRRDTGTAVAIVVVVVVLCVGTTGLFSTAVLLFV